MKKITLTFGLVSAGSLAGLYILMCLTRNSGNTVLSPALVYAAVLLLFVLLFWSIKSYRDHAQGGFITFGKAFRVGILMSLVSSLCYAVLWMILYNPVFKGFMEQHAAAVMAQLKTGGASAGELAAKKEEMLEHAALYQSPFFRAVLIFIQGFPVETIMAGIASFILKKKL